MINGSFNEVANVNDASNATFEVIPANATRRWEIATLLVSTNTAGNFTVKSGTNTLIGPVYVAANTVTIIDPPSGTIKLNKGEALNITKGTAGHGYTVYAQYRDMG